MRNAKLPNVLHIPQTPSKKMMGFSATRLPSLSATMACMAFLRAFGSGRLLARLAFRQRSLNLADAAGAQNVSSPDRERMFERCGGSAKRTEEDRAGPGIGFVF